MTYQYTPFVAPNLDELKRQLYWLIGIAPKFVSYDGMFVGMNIDAEFDALSESLEFLKPQLGNALFTQLAAMASETKAHFEADPDDTTGEAKLGNRLLVEMVELLIDSMPFATNDE